MIDPTDITKFNRSTFDLEMFWLFSIAVAGKKSDVAAKKVQQLYDRLIARHQHMGHTIEVSPLELVYYAVENGTFMEDLVAVKIGQYGRIHAAFAESATSVVVNEFNLRTCVPEDLEQFTGVGPKTARFFIMHTQEGMEMAALDTHILRWLRDLGYSAPKVTPSGKKYAHLEALFLTETKKRGMTVADLDLGVWNHYSQKKAGVPFLLETV